MGSATPGEGAKWFMQEYSVEPDNQSYVLCRLKKKPNDKAYSTPHSGEGKPSYNIVSEVENHETPAAFPQNSLQAHGHEEVTQKFRSQPVHSPVRDLSGEVSTRSFIASGEQEESPDKIMNQLMADSDSQSYGETSYHWYTTLQSASSPRQRSGDGLLGSDMNTEGVIQQDSFQAQGDEEVIQGLRSQPLYSPVRETMGYHPSLGHIGQSASSAKPHSGYDREEVKFCLSYKSTFTNEEAGWTACYSEVSSGGSINRLDLDVEEHLEYVTAGMGRTQELQASFSSTETPPNKVGEEAEMRNSILPSEYSAIVLFLIMILFTAFDLLVYVAWKLC